MADELTVGCELSISKDSTSETVSLRGIKVDVSGSNIIHNRQDVGTSEEALVLGDVAAGGYMICINRGPTNYVEIRPNTGLADLIKLKVGEPALFRLAADAVPYAIADTATVELEYWIVED